MLSAIRLENFKGFGPGSPWIELRDLTLLLGPNSSGKSTIVQALLMVAQTWEKGLSGIGRLVSTGDHVDLGTFGSIFHRPKRLGAEPSTTGLRLGLQRDEWRLTLEWDTGWRPGSDAPWPSVAELRELTIESLRSGSWSTRITLRVRDVARHKVVLSSIPGADLSEFAAGLSPMISPAEPGHELQSSAEGHESAAVGPPSGFTVELDDVAGVLCSPHEPTPAAETSAAAVQALVGNTVSQFRALALTTSHIGPLRLRGQRLYETRRAGSPWRVGHRGQHLVDVLLGDGVLAEANRLADLLDIGYRIEVVPTGRSADVYELLLAEQRGDVGLGNDVLVGLPDVGSGVAQVLPLIAQLAAMRGSDGPKEAIILIEQPELHLHPRLQGRLAKAFAAAIAPPTGERRRAQLILETHSEHLAYALGTEVKRDAEREDVRDLADRILCLTLSPLTEDQVGPRVSSVSYLPDGEFDGEFPYGFFEERLDLQEARYGDSGSES